MPTLSKLYRSIAALNPRRPLQLSNSTSAQLPSETVVDYSNRLKRAAVECQFAGHLDRVLKDRFITGLASQMTRKKLLTTLEDKLDTFEKVLSIAKTDELANTYSREL